MHNLWFMLIQSAMVTDAHDLLQDKLVSQILYGNIDAMLASDKGLKKRITGGRLIRTRAGDRVGACDHIEWMHLERSSIPGPGLARGVEQSSRYVD
jgi:hypothetical protein